MITISDPSVVQYSTLTLEAPTTLQQLITSEKESGATPYYFYSNERNNVWFISNKDIFGCLLVENNLLRRAVQNLWKTYLYNREYTGFLLGTYSKEQFCEMAKAYAEPLEENVDEDVVRYAGGLFPEILNRTIDATDMSVILNVDQKRISDICALGPGTTHAFACK